ncbi:hypothetical protein L596_002330 [Steinernema carpocapsae]|uniref:Uncharacterized protein n=1 Tax=Steinernema carpocapsae TaxID=34508 RepID=A0A4U8UQT6_STECR|nr:hypothetical protein L596_002330 [Steinernema carpocapsae]
MSTGKFFRFFADVARIRSAASPEASSITSRFAAVCYLAPTSGGCPSQCALDAKRSKGPIYPEASVTSPTSASNSLHFERNKQFFAIL